MWSIELIDGYFWAIADGAKAGPFIRKAEARHYAATNKAPVPFPTGKKKEAPEPRPPARETETSA